MTKLALIRDLGEVIDRVALLYDRLMDRSDGIIEQNPVKSIGQDAHETAALLMKAALAGFEFARERDVPIVVSPEESALREDDEKFDAASTGQLAAAVEKAATTGDPSAILEIAYPPGTPPEGKKLTPPTEATGANPPELES